ncbi:ALF repeat-containing protein [Kitasatospora sp. NPDC101801]|uniref:ALF repeat-containing protein n=1 Tax=Kitasatospora sp. NPDC101801 TaxID=3364103 RepID=UPI00382B7F6C
MKIRRSLAAAVFLATAAAPAAMAATPAFADSAPAGQEQADQAGTKQDEENRAAIEKLLVYPNDYLLTAPSDYLREHAAAALAGTPEDRARFLASEVDRIRVGDAQIAIIRLMSAGGPVLKKAAEAAFEAKDIEKFRAFLTVGQYTARTEDENRAKVQRILDDPSSGPVVRERAEKALAGTAADVERFLATGYSNGAEHDARIKLSQIMSAGGPAVQQAANTAMSGTVEDVLEFLKTGQYVARAEDENRAEVQRIIDDPSTGRHVREAAEKALAGTAVAVEHFLRTELESLRVSDDLIRATGLADTGGPEVRKAGNAALNGTIEDVRAFLKEGQYTARAKDEAAAKAAAEAAQGGSGGAKPDTAVVPAADSTGTPVTPVTTTDGQDAGDRLASTGTTTPLAQLAGLGGAAVVLGAGVVVAARRRTQV